MLPFEIIAPDIDEAAKAGEDAVTLVERLAVEKAQAVAKGNTDALIIGSDQVAVHGDEIVGKPRDHTHAVEQLRAASGQEITLHTGLALINGNSGRIQSTVVPYTVKFKKLNDRQIQRYLEKERPYGCSGSLRADGLGIVLLERFAGDDPNALIGLPLIALTEMLQNEGVDLFA